MDKYAVLMAFPDRMDKDHKYKKGDAYPRDGYKPPEGRSEALAEARISVMNQWGKAVIEKSKEDK